MSEQNTRESELIIMLTGKTRDQVFGEYTLPELIRLSGLLMFYGSC